MAEESETINRTRDLLEESIKILCCLSTVKTNRFYIPGETNLVEKLRKRAMDTGIFAAISTIYYNLKPQNPSCERMKKYIREKSLNMMELSDLQYHHKVIEKQIESLRSPKFDCENIQEIEEKIDIVDSPAPSSKNKKSQKREKSEPRLRYQSKTDMIEEETANETPEKKNQSIA